MGTQKSAVVLHFFCGCSILNLELPCSHSLKRKIGMDTFYTRAQVVYRRLSSFDLTEVKELLIKKHGLSPDTVEEMEEKYKLHLALAVSRPNVDLAIPLPVNYMWQAHIACPISYKRMWQEVLNHFLPPDNSLPFSIEQSLVLV